MLCVELLNVHCMQANHHNSNCISMYNLDLFPTTSSCWLTIAHAKHGINWRRPVQLWIECYIKGQEAIINGNGLAIRSIIVFGVTLLYLDLNIFIISSLQVMDTTKLIQIVLFSLFWDGLGCGFTGMINSKTKGCYFRPCSHLTPVFAFCVKIWEWRSMAINDVCIWWQRSKKNANADVKCKQGSAIVMKRYFIMGRHF